VAEWGDGIYGADAAARYWFQKSAAELQPEEAAVLAAMLPAPRKRNPVRPSPGLRKRAREILRLYSMYGELSPDELARRAGACKRSSPVVEPAGNFDVRTAAIRCAHAEHRRAQANAELDELEEAKALIRERRLRGAGGTPGGVGTFFLGLLCTVVADT